MNAFFSGTGGSALLFVLTVTSGILLSHSGRPYPTVIFNIHKLIAVGAVFIIVRNIYHLQQATALRAYAGPGALLVTGLLFAALVISGSVLSMQNGGLLSLQAPLLETMHTVHQVAPVLTLIAAGLSLGFMAGARAA
jgi:hypothetical protein